MIVEFQPDTKVNTITIDTKHIFLRKMDQDNKTSYYVHILDGNYYRVTKDTYDKIKEQLQK